MMSPSNARARNLLRAQQSPSPTAADGGEKRNWLPKIPRQSHLTAAERVQHVRNVEANRRRSRLTAHHQKIRTEEAYERMSLRGPSARGPMAGADVPTAKPVRAEKRHRQKGERGCCSSL